MTTTAFDDQFTDAPEPVRQPYDAGSILRRNVADLELALKQQTERAEAAEAELLAVREDNHSMMLEIDGLRKELAKMRNQKPALYVSFSDCGNFIRYWTRDTKNLEATMAVNDFEVLEFYARPIPAPAALEMLRDILNTADAKSIFDKLSDGQGIGTDDGRTWIAASALMQSAEVRHD